MSDSDTWREACKRLESTIVRMTEDESKLRDELTDLQHSIDPLPDIDSLPELTDEERDRLKLVDMTPILGTPEERISIAVHYGLKQFRKRRKLEAEIERLRSALEKIALQDGKLWNERMEIAREALK